MNKGKGGIASVVVEVMRGCDEQASQIRSDKGGGRRIGGYPGRYLEVQRAGRVYS